MMAGRILPGYCRKVIRQQAQTCSADVWLTVDPHSAGLKRAENGPSQRSPAPSYLQRFYRAGAQFPAFQGLPRAVVCLPEAIGRALGALAGRPPGAYTPSGPFRALHAVTSIFKSPLPALPVGVAGTPPVHGPAALAPARRGRAQNLDARDHSVPQFHPELLQKTGAEEPELGGPGR